MNCKACLKEISINGNIISPEAKRHIALCRRCARFFRFEKELEGLFRESGEIVAPESLKKSVLINIGLRPHPKEKSPLSVLVYAFKLAGIAAVILFGFWLGLQTANGSSNDIDLSDTGVYTLNTQPVSPASLGDIYFAVLEDSGNEQNK